MAVPHISGAFGDLLDPRFQMIFNDDKDQLDDMIPTLYGMVPSNGRDEMKWSGVGAVPDFTQWGGSVAYSSQAQGFDTTATYIQFSNGIQVERPLFDDDQYNIMDTKPSGLRESADRTRQVHAARMWNLAFSVDGFGFYSNTEGVALCSNSHTTTSGASTANGFDNLTTAAISATAVRAARIQMRKFRGDVAERISVMPDELWYPTDLYGEVFEIIESQGNPEDATNARNVHQNKFVGHEWEYMTDVNNWFMTASRTRQKYLKWVDRIPLEFAMMEDFDMMTAKWRAYMRYAHAWLDWRFVLGAQVS